MSTKFQCPFCPRFFSKSNGLSQHLNLCRNTFNSSTEESSEISEIISDVNDMSLDNEEFQNVLESLPSGSEIRENSSVVQDLFEFEEYEGYAGDDSLISSIIPDSELFEEMLQSHEEFRNSESDEEMLQSQSIEESRNSEESFRSIEEEPEIENKEFPNEAYADLMALVIKHNINNKAGNAIIKFFNKYSNVNASPLPKNIEAGRKYIDKMKLSQFSHHKQPILFHNNVEYFIHYRPVFNCIENLLSNSEITQHFAYDYENLEVNFNIYKIFLSILILYYTKLFFYSLRGKNHMENNILETGGKMQQNQFQNSQIFCLSFYIQTQLQLTLWVKAHFTLYTFLSAIFPHGEEIRKMPNNY